MFDDDTESPQAREQRHIRERREHATRFAAASRLESAWHGVPFDQRLNPGRPPKPEGPAPTEAITEVLRWAGGEPLTATDLRELTGLPKERVSSVLAQIQRRGLIAVEKAHNASRYCWRSGRGVEIRSRSPRRTTSLSTVV